MPNSKSESLVLHKLIVKSPPKKYLSFSSPPWPHSWTYRSRVCWELQPRHKLKLNESRSYVSSLKSLAVWDRRGSKFINGRAYYKTHAIPVIPVAQPLSLLPSNFFLFYCYNFSFQASSFCEKRKKNYPVWHKILLRQRRSFRWRLPAHFVPNHPVLNSWLIFHLSQRRFRQVVRATIAK